MKTTNYPGIDYGRGISNTGANGIRYGVISQYSVNPEVLDEIFTHGKDMAWEAAFEEAIDKARKSAANPDEVNPDDIAENIGMNWESSLSNMLFEKDGYKLTGCLDSDVFVLDSPFFTVCQFCSPCVPGAGNLDSPFESAENQASLDGTDYLAEAAGFPRVYCLGHDWFESGMAPYAVYSVSTGKIVMPDNT